MGGGMAIAAAETYPDRFGAVASFHCGEHQYQGQYVPSGVELHHLDQGPAMKRYCWASPNRRRRP
jgi:enterochelin esterase-like enzyme